MQFSIHIPSIEVAGVDSGGEAGITLDCEGSTGTAVTLSEEGAAQAIAMIAVSQIILAMILL